jgi:hypothetical protein
MRGIKRDTSFGELADDGRCDLISFTGSSA